MAHTTILNTFNIEKCEHLDIQVPVFDIYESTYFTSSAGLSIKEPDPEAIKSSSTIASISLWAVRMPRMFPVRKIDAWATSSSDLLSEPQVDDQQSTNYFLLILARTGLICDFYLALERLLPLKFVKIEVR
ncbi:hypothetical protein BOTCAL_0079g00260 [Botryotinia calthae]|uniref:Uncharacterized protein n=1 Tax=Botryotinia calthae TaxID=38488 RepID=A0A4Y8D835_9HELO|nr:hypothetical protein BOTCAL_0079g00260 [Botryotinia calthae]